MTCSAKTRPSEQAFVSALKRRHVGWAMRARQRAHRSSFSLLVIVGRPWTVKVGEDGRFGDLLVLRSGQRRQTQRADACPKRSKCGGQKAEEGRRWPKKLRSPARFKNALAHPSPLPLTKTCGTQQDEPAAKTPKNAGSVMTVTQILEGVPTYSEPWTSKSEQTYSPPILQMSLRLGAGTVGECGTVGTVDAS